MRIARAARSLGATSLSICAPEDIHSPHVEFADKHFVLPKGETAIAPYLDIERLTEVAVENGVDFVHPGKYDDWLHAFEYIILRISCKLTHYIHKFKHRIWISL